MESDVFLMKTVTITLRVPDDLEVNLNSLESEVLTIIVKKNLEKKILNSIALKSKLTEDNAEELSELIKQAAWEKVKNETCD
jgi:translation elongation factor EF-1beta